MSVLDETPHGRALVRELRKRKLRVEYEVRALAEALAAAQDDVRGGADWAVAAAGEVADRYESLRQERIRACEALGWRPSKSVLLAATTVTRMLGVTRERLDELIQPVAEDVNPHYKSASPMRLYDPRDVLRARGEDAASDRGSDSSRSPTSSTARAASPVRATVRRAYRRMGTLPRSLPRQPFEVDPNLVDRGNQAHATTQDALADFLLGADISPWSPSEDEPDFDLAWEHARCCYVAEVKSLTLENEEKQLRLGLGQVLRYRQALQHASRPTVIAVLVAERRPTDNTWLGLCQRFGVILTWPPFASLKLA
jgi:hypothetical protein